MKSITINSERISANEYIDFLKRTDLGTQYPKERFSERIEKLVKNADISVIARNSKNKIIGVCFCITDFSYWMFVTDLGVDREYEKQGIGSRLMNTAHKLAGGEKDINIYLCANSNAIPFYEKLGMTKSDEIFELCKAEFTAFTVE